MVTAPAPNRICIACLENIPANEEDVGCVKMGDKAHVMWRGDTTGLLEDFVNEFATEPPF